MFKVICVEIVFVNANIESSDKDEVFYLLKKLSQEIKCLSCLYRGERI